MSSSLGEHMKKLTDNQKKQLLSSAAELHALMSQKKELEQRIDLIRESLWSRFFDRHVKETIRFFVGKTHYIIHGDPVIKAVELHVQEIKTLEDL
jgi:hypothetical protein